MEKVEKLIADIIFLPAKLIILALEKIGIEKLLKNRFKVLRHDEYYHMTIKEANKLKRLKWKQLQETPWYKRFLL